MQHVCGRLLERYEAYSKGMKLNSSSHGIWVTEPMTNSNRLMEKAKKHADSKQHNVAADFIAGSQPTIIVAVDRQIAQSTSDGAKFFPSMLNAAYTLFKQEIPHTTNWQATITNLCFSNSEFLTWYKSLPNYACYHSTTAMTSMLKAFDDETREFVYSKIRSSVSKYGGYSFIGDEAEDESGVSKLPTM